MAVEKNQGGDRARSRININEAYQLFDWAEKLGISTGLLRRTVQAVGRDPAAVRQYLQAAR